MWLIAATALAKPTAPAILCGQYPSAPDCEGKVVACAYCHESTDPPAWNAYGNAVKANLPAGVSFELALPSALQAIESMDADGDGESDLDELLAGTMPGKADTMQSGADSGPRENPRYRVDGYDAAFALRRVLTLYCGRSPSYDELAAVRGADDVAARGKLHETLSACLQSEFWTQTQLPRLADKRIKPLAAAGPDSQIQIAGYRLVIGDYNFDYRLWRYVLSNDRDMRELLTADYFVLEAADGSLVQSWDKQPRTDDKTLAGGQLIEREHRVGMISTQWFLAINTMFSALPRTTAAQAYRSYLGADIASSEGLIPIQGEPTDIDKKGVAQARCAVCHSTLDPLSYAFAPYEGIQVSADLNFGAYLPNRPTQRMPGWNDAAQRPYLLGEPVANLVEWARAAAESDQFARNMAEVFFAHALGRKPEAADQAEFGPLWKSTRDDGYSANRLVHRLVDTLSFGAP